MQSWPPEKDRKPAGYLTLLAAGIARGSLVRIELDGVEVYGIALGFALGTTEAEDMAHVMPIDKVRALAIWLPIEQVKRPAALLEAERDFEVKTIDANNCAVSFGEQSVTVTTHGTPVNDALLGATHINTMLRKHGKELVWACAIRNTWESDQMDIATDMCRYFALRLTFWSVQLHWHAMQMIDRPILRGVGR